MGDGSESNMTLKSQNSFSRKKTMIIKTSQLNEAEKEVDWRDRLRQWKQVGQSSGSITSFADA